MLELGSLAEDEHTALLEAADRAGADLLILVGAEIAGALASRPDGLATPHHAFADSAAAAAGLSSLVQAGDVLLVKGSRGIRTERLFEGLTKGR